MDGRAARGAAQRTGHATYRRCRARAQTSVRTPCRVHAREEAWDARARRKRAQARTARVTAGTRYRAMDLTCWGPANGGAVGAGRRAMTRGKGPLASCGRPSGVGMARRGAWRWPCARCAHVRRKQRRGRWRSCCVPARRRMPSPAARFATRRLVRSTPRTIFHRTSPTLRPPSRCSRGCSPIQASTWWSPSAMDGSSAATPWTSGR